MEEGATPAQKLSRPNKNAAGAEKSEDLWTSYNTLRKTVFAYLSGGDSPKISQAEFEGILRNHKQNFFSLLQNQPKNATSREELKKGMVDGIVIRGAGHQILSKELYREVEIISDMFDLHEYHALDLLCTAQIKASFYPDLPRGKIAVLLYYDGRKSLVSTLRCLVQARSGIQWSLKTAEYVQKFCTDYTDQLAEGGVFNRIFDLLRTLDITKELEMLQDPRHQALGGPRHVREVVDQFQDIKVMLADIVFTWSTQSGLPRQPTLALMAHLRHVDLDQEASGVIDDVTLYLEMSLLAALDLSVLHTREDGEDLVQKLPILSDPDYLSAVINDMRSDWTHEGLHCLAELGLSVCLASLRLLPQSLKYQDLIVKEELFIDHSVERVFDFAYHNFLESKTLYKESFMVKRLHNLFTDFVVYMYPKVKELRIKADEIARTVLLYTRGGVTPPALCQNFEHLLLSLSKFYRLSSQESYGDLVSDYWSPVEINQGLSHSQQSTSSPRAVSLFKFIRLAGEMLPQTLFVPYLTLLASLSTNQQSARHCFNMLKQVGPQLAPFLSWDHFFQSFAQYYNNLRQEMTPSSDTVYNRSNAHLKGVSPHELQGLHAVLRLVRTVANHDEFSRLALCEHPGWASLSILLGLVGCSVPMTLKSDLLLTLASLSKSIENANQTWDNLENSQILVTIPTTSSYVPRGIQTELDEIESRLGEYPLTRALLTLLDALTEFGIPRTLGAGPRKPGFDPYLSFVINSIFLKVTTRHYNDPKEKWQITQLCLKLFHKFLTQYDPQQSDFATSGDFNPPPGYHVMLQMSLKSEFLNAVLDVIGEGCDLFDTYSKFPGWDLVDACTLTALELVHAALALQPRFMNVANGAQCATIVTSLPKLLLTTNRRSNGKPDYCVNILKYVTYQPYVTRHIYVAVKILNHVTRVPHLHNHFMTIFLSCDSVEEIKGGFVRSLDCDFDDESLGIKIKVDVFKLIKQCLSYNAPNFSHLLLGFDVTKEIHKTEFQFPGVLDCARSCLHSIIALLESEIRREASTKTPLMEAAYEVLYLLVSNGRTYRPILRFLRINQDFYTNHLKLCLGRLGNSIHVANQMSFLMKIMAVELKVCSQSRQINYLIQLTKFLIGLPQFDLNPHPFNLTHEPSVREDYIVNFERISDSFLNKIVPRLEFTVEEVPVPQWQFFEPKVLTSVIDKCRYIDGRTINLKKLHQRLYDEIRQLQGSAVMGQIQAISQEIPKVLKYALELNKHYDKETSVCEFVNGFRQVVEVLMLFIPSEVLTPKETQLAGMTFVKNIVTRVPKTEVGSTIGRHLSGAVLVIFDNLYKCYQYDLRQRKLHPERVEHNLLIPMHLGSMRGVLENLVEWLIVSSSTDEQLRANLYSALDTMLHFAGIEKDDHDFEEMDDNTYVSRLDNASKLMCYRNPKIAVDVLGQFGEKFVDLLCQDCIGGFDICKMLSLSCLSFLLSMSGDVNWIYYLSRRGYLKFVIQSLSDGNQSLEQLLEVGHQHTKPLYLYKSRMQFLIKLACNRVGAELLLEQKIFATLSQMEVLKYHPDSTANADILDGYVEQPDDIYMQIWLPTLHLSNTILTTLGTDNQSAVCHIMYYIMSHIDTVEAILRTGSVSLHDKYLEELSLVTSVIARCASNDLVTVLENPANSGDAAQLYRLQKLVLGLLSRFILSTESVKDLLTPVTLDQHSFQTSNRLLASLDVMSNILTYARNVVANHGIDHRGAGVVLQPSLNGPTIRLGAVAINQKNSIGDQATVGVVVQQLINTVAHYNRENFTLELLKRKLKEVSSMANADLEEFVGKESARQDSDWKREVVFDLLEDRLRKKRKEMDRCGYIIECCVYLIWVHLDYYMLRAIPRVKNLGGNVSLNDSALPSASEATWKVSTDDISALKHGLVSIFNDSFMKQLGDTMEGRSDLDKGFVETMMAKVIRLIQFVPVK